MLAGGAGAFHGVFFARAAYFLYFGAYTLLCCTDSRVLGGVVKQPGHLMAKTPEKNSSENKHTLCECGHHHGAATWKSSVAQGIFVLLALAYLLLAPDKAQVQTVAITFVAIVLEALPFVLLGALIGGLIEVFVPREWVARLLPANAWGPVFFAGLLGLIFPVCECAIVPVIRRLLKKGVPLGAAITFLLAAPIMNPLVALSTAVAYAFAWEVVFARLFVGYAIAVAIGLIMDSLFTDKAQALAPVLLEQDHDAGACHHHPDAAAPSLFRRLVAAVQHGTEEFFDVGRFLIIGAFFAAILQGWVSRESIAGNMGSSVIAILMMMGLAFVLNLCSEADAFIAASFRSSGMPFPAQLAFMILGPMLDIKLLIMYHGVFKPKMILALVSAIIMFVFVAMIAMVYL